MAAAPAFDLSYRVVTLAGLPTLELRVRLLFVIPDTGERIDIPFRIDSGADVSMIPADLWNTAIQPLTNWPTTVGFRTASDETFPARRAVGVQFQFLPLLGERFRTDFAIATGPGLDHGLLAWRDVAFDFDIRTVTLPRTYPDGSLAFPGSLRLTLRPDRFPVRVG